MREYLGRLVLLAHPNDYDTVREIEQELEDYWETGDGLEMVESVLNHDTPEGLGFDDTTGGLAVWRRVANGVQQADEAAGKLRAVRALARDAGLIEPGDQTTDVVPLLRMFLLVG